MTTKNTFSVYRIWSPSSTLEYYGSTTQTLSQRLGGHARNHRKWQAGKYHYVSSFEVLRFPDARIELVEIVDTKLKSILQAREGYYIRNFECVNKNVAGRTQAEWYVDNRETILQKQNTYKATHRAEIAVRDGVKVECPCGTTCEKLHLSVHKKSKKHLEFFAKNPSAVELNLKPPPVDFTKVLCVNCGRSKIECRKLPHAKIPPEGNTDLTATSS